MTSGQVPALVMTTSAYTRTQSVPPVWQAIQGLWAWLDNDLSEQPYDEDQPIGDRRAWWEDMVKELVKRSGVLSLV
jgi:hypothetical protein